VATIVRPEVTTYQQYIDGEWTGSAAGEINDWHLLNPLAPFGGYRQSGTGRELGAYGLREYTEVKHIHVDQNVPRRERYFYDVLLG
jgi:hypothetical protein